MATIEAFLCRANERRQPQLSDAVRITAAIALPAVSLLCTPASWPRWLVMWLMVATIYGGLKALTSAAASRDSRPTWRQLAYLFLWPGLNAPHFLTQDASQRVAIVTVADWLEGLLNTLAGAALFWTAACWFAPSHSIILGWAGMVGTILFLHFGAFQLLSCAWRSNGVDARPLMNHPTRATSVAHFWGRRWNTAFRDVTHEFLFRPLTTRVGATVALAIVFIFSGVLHELVISVPAAGGYGGPTMYFCIQAAALLFERSPAGRAIGLGRGWRGWAFAAIVLLLPVRLLFHDPFILRVVLPLMQATGAA